MKEGWTYKRLGDLCRIRTGKLDANAADDDGLYPFFTCSVTPLRINKYAYDCECVLVAGNGDLNVKYYSGKFNAYQRTYIIESNDKNVLDVRYLYMFLSEYVTILRKKSIGAIIKYIKLGYLTEAKLLLPPISEQQSIFEYLDSAFAKIDALKANAEQALNEAKALFQASLKEMLEPKEGWEEKTLKEIVHPDCSLSYGIVQPGEHVKDGVPVVRPVDFNDKVIVRAEGLKRTKREISDAYKRTILKGGEILLCVRGTTGTMGLASDELQGCNVTRGIVPIFFGDNVNKMFVYYQLLSPKLQREIQKKTTGAALKQINIKDLRAILLMFPPISEQQSIVATLDSLKSKVDRLQENCDKISQECDALKQAILREVFE